MDNKRPSIATQINWPNAPQSVEQMPTPMPTNSPWYLAIQKWFQGMPKAEATPSSPQTTEDSGETIAERIGWPSK